MILLRIVLVALISSLLLVADVQAQDLASARDLYASAQYDEALRMLDSLPAETSTNDERLSIDLYRTLCLLAVGRRDDADRAMEQIVLRDPLFRPGDDLPPRTRTSFSEARRRVLPTLLQSQYAEAKDIFDRKEYESAAVAFKLVVDAINDPDLVTVAQQSPLADLRTLAEGFLDLSVKAIPPPPPPAPEPVAEPVPVVPAAPRIFGGEETGVKAPVTVTQDIPRYPGIVPAMGIRGIIEVVIDETGHVESAVMLSPISAAYDKLLLNASRRWEYQPAQHLTEPVKFRKRVQINIAPSR
jgi:hypothetical protein